MIENFKLWSETRETQENTKYINLMSVFNKIPRITKYAGTLDSTTQWSLHFAGYFWSGPTFTKTLYSQAKEREVVITNILYPNITKTLKLSNYETESPNENTEGLNFFHQIDGMYTAFHEKNYVRARFLKKDFPAGSYTIVIKIKDQYDTIYETNKFEFKLE